MHTIVQIFLLFLAFIFLGSLLSKEDEKRFEKVLSMIACFLSIAFVLFIQEVLK